MTTPADHPAVEEAFEAYLAGRPVPGDAGDSVHAVTAFSEAVRASATGPGRPNAALAELLATGLLADQPSPSIRAARSAGSPSSRGASRIRRRRRFAMFFPALLAKMLSAGAVAQAATGAGIVLVVATGAGATGVLGEDVQATVSSVVGTTSEEPTEDVVAGDETTEAEIEPTPVVETTAPAEPTEAGPEAWIEKGPEGYSSFGAWVSASAHNTELRDWLRAEGRNFGSMVRDWAHRKGLDDADLAEEGVDLDESTDATPAPAPAPEVETETAEVGTATIERGGNRGNGKAGAEGNGGQGNGGHGNGGHGNGGQGNGGQGNGGHGNSGKGNGRN
jgi:hypothetical protein